MSTRFTGRWSRVWITAAISAALMVGASVGVLVGASSTPQLHACVQKTSSLMRYTTGTTCKSGEKLVTWNVQGAAGPKGAAGATGPAGALTVYHADGGPIGFQGTMITTRLRVPAGEYLVTWVVSGVTSTGALTSCTLEAAGLGALATYASFAEATLILLRCTADGVIRIDHAEIIAQPTHKLVALPT